MRHRRIIIGTRGSKLACAQAAIVAQRLNQIEPYREIETKIVITSGDRDQHSHLAAIGGKGIFIRELEQALIDGTIDVAVHSFKDVTSQLAPSLSLSAFLRPESVCDVMVTHGTMPLEYLPPGALVGTGSMRRKTLLQRLRPDLATAEIRGNIDTRIAKVDRQEYDGVMLSEAGLIRLGLEERIAVRFDPSSFYPAPGQGVITLEIRESDEGMRELCAAVGDARQHSISTAELTLLGTIGFDCRTPLGVYSTVNGEQLRMRGFFVAAADGEFRECSTEGPLSDPASIGRRMGELLLKRGAEQ